MVRVVVVVVVVKKEVGLAEGKLWRKEDLRVVWQRRGVMNMETEGGRQGWCDYADTDFDGEAQAMATKILRY